MIAFRTDKALILGVILLSSNALAEAPPMPLLPPATVGTEAPAVTAPAEPLAPAFLQTAVADHLPAQPPATPVETASLSSIKPESIGMLAGNDGGLGAGLWKGTSRTTAIGFMPVLSLPLNYASLNNLAERFLLTTASAPEGTASAGEPSITSLRVGKLIELGRSVEAWRLANVAGLEQIDDAVLRQAVEYNLVTPSATDVCAKLPEILKKHTNIEWQKSMLVCQLQAKDVKGAQVSVDLLHAQDIHDDAFFSIAEKNLISPSTKQLPRQLTPLKPLTLALLQLTDVPVRSDVYARPDAALIPALLKVKAADENARLSLAERSAAKGILSAKELAEIYEGQNFSSEALANVDITGEQGPILRALLYQASKKERTDKNRLNQAIKFLGSLDATTSGGAVLALMGDIIGDVRPNAEANEISATIARIYLLAGKPNNAMAWLEQARNVARGTPQVDSDLRSLWPLAAASGVETQKDFGDNLDKWAGFLLQNPDVDSKAVKTTIMSMLLLLDATGFTANDATWVRIADNISVQKAFTPSPLVIQRLREAGSANHKGEAVLMGLLASIASKDEVPLSGVIETVRALRAVGLQSDAGMLAKDAVVRLLVAPPKG